MDFIGCQNKTTSTDSSKKLANALVRFCTNKKYDDAKTRDIKNAVYYYCIECINAKKEISLSAISALINPENPDEFQEFASSEENEVDEIISGDKTILKTLNYVKYRTPDLTVEFNNKLIGVQIFYSDKKNELTIKNVPDELRKQITQ
jgi:nucleoid-associated protein YejK